MIKHSTDHIPPGSLVIGMPNEERLILEARWILAARYQRERRCAEIFYAMRDDVREPGRVGRALDMLDANNRMHGVPT